jgi:citrate synthase
MTATTSASAPARPSTPGSTGLEGVVAADTRLSRVDGDKGELLIGGFPVEQLAPEVTFAETAFLLWYGHLPSADALAHFERELATHRGLSKTTGNLIEHLIEDQLALDHTSEQGAVHPMDLLRAAAATLQPAVAPREAAGPDDPPDIGTALRVVASLPTIIATGWRRSSGLEAIAPRQDLSHCANFLYMVTGNVPTAAATRALDTYCNTVVDHGMNASTFTARVIISTHSDLVSAVVGAIGALKGPLHGGAPGPALDMVFEIGMVPEIDRAQHAETYLRDKIGRGERLMGFGHRVYKVRDPRAEVLSAAVERLMHSQSTSDGQQARELLALYDLTRTVEETAIRLLEEAKPGRRIQTNVEFYTALLLHSIGLPRELFTPTFAMARSVGWCAHAFEQLATGRLIRPRANYTGPVYDHLPSRP